MRITSSVTSISWIPSEAIDGMPKLPFSFGTFHYDQTPPDSIGPAREILEPSESPIDSASPIIWRRGSRSKTARSSRCGYNGGGGSIGATKVKVGLASWFVAAAPLPDRIAEPRAGDGWVRFTQTAGGRTGVPAPRTVRRPPFVQYRAPIAWTTLTLTMHADGHSEYEVTGASPFPRHWIYDDTGRLAKKSGTTQFKDWWKRAFGKHTPWGDLDSPALVTEVETALERELSNSIMRGGQKPDIRKVKKGATLVEQGSEGDELFLLLDGVLAVDVDGSVLAEVGPGAVVGERAALEGGRRTSTLRAITPCKVAAVASAQIDRKRSTRCRLAIAGSLPDRAFGYVVRVDRLPRSERTSTTWAATRRASRSVTTTARRRWFSTREPVCATSPASSTARRFGARSCSAICIGITPTGCRSSPPVTDPDACTHLLLPAQGVEPIELLARTMSPPHFPIGPHQLRGDWSFGVIDRGAYRFEGFDVLVREIPHKGGKTLGFRVSDGGRSLAYLSDHAPQDRGAGHHGVGALHDDALDLARDVDVLVHDAQYTADELPQRGSFGHAAYEYSLELAAAAGARRVLLFHHDPSRTDPEVDVDPKETATARAAAAGWRYPRDRTTFVIGEDQPSGSH